MGPLGAELKATILTTILGWIIVIGQILTIIFVVLFAPIICLVMLIMFFIGKIRNKDGDYQ